MRWGARTAPGSRLVFTYVHRDVLSKPEIFFGAREMFAVLDRAGERYTFGFEPGAVPDFLAERGLALESDVGAADYRARYLGDRARGIRGHEFYRIAQARVL
jgi:O-methyltransferase involved in polyketide biosynthesis